MNRFLRCLICLMLICSLMVSISPIQAEALSPGLAFAAGSVVASALIGLGISMGSDAFAHNEVVQNAVAYLEEVGGYITEGMTTIVNLGSGRYGLRSDMIADLFGFLFHSGTLKAPPSFGFEKTAAYGSLTYVITSPVPITTLLYYYHTTSGSQYYQLIAVANESCSISCLRKQTGMSDSTETLNVTNAFGNQFYVRLASGSISKLNLEGAVYDQIIYGGTFSSKSAGETAMKQIVLSSEVTTESDLTLNFVATPGLSLAEGYPEWHANSITIDGETYYPVALAPTYEGTQSMTQTDVWVGNGSYVDSEAGTGTGSGTVTVPDNATLKDILAGVLTLPQAIAQAVSGLFANVVSAVQAIPAAIQAIPAAIADFFSVKGEVGSFTISLSDYFPFCIPFDLFDFFACLYADPVAPVIEWAIFERDGTAHPIIIDLSAYDSVAQLLRRLQLLLFCVGLAFKTRDLIKG